MDSAVQVSGSSGAGRWEFRCWSVEVPVLVSGSSGAGRCSERHWSDLSLPTCAANRPSRHFWWRRSPHQKLTCAGYPTNQCRIPHRPASLSTLTRAANRPSRHFWWRRSPHQKRTCAGYPTNQCRIPHRPAPDTPPTCASA